MTEKTTAAGAGPLLSEQLGPAGECAVLLRLCRLRELLEAGRSVDAYKGTAALTAAIDAIEQLRARLLAIDRHSVNTLRTKSADLDDWAEDVAFIGKLARGH